MRFLCRKKVLTNQKPFSLARTCVAGESGAVERSNSRLPGGAQNGGSATGGPTAGGGPEDGRGEVEARGGGDGDLAGEQHFKIHLKKHLMNVGQFV